MRKLGIIGGTSWASTALYYEHINRGVARRLGGLHSARLAIESLDLAPVAELERSGDWDGVARRLGGLHSARLAIESLDLAPVAELELSGDWDGVAAIMINAAKSLAKSGADGLLIASNTGHKAYSAVAAAVRIPVLHIADATAEKLVEDQLSRVALLGTRFTMTEDYVRERLEKRGIALAPVDPKWMQEVDRIIFEELAAGRVIRDSQRKLKTLIAELARHKVQAVVLGCTELVLAVDTRANVIPVYDTTAIHARAAVEWMLAEQVQAKAAA